MFPSIETVGFGFMIAAVLAILDWYVWRSGPVLPYPLTDPQHKNEEEPAAFKKVA